MKNSITALFLFLFFTLSAQDVIVLKDNSVIRCKIDSVSPKSVYFTFRNDHGKISTYVSTDKVLGYRYGEMENENTDKKPDAYPVVRIALNGGFSYRYAKANEELSEMEKDFYDKLRTGNYFAGDIEFYHKNIGFGIKYNSSWSEESTQAAIDVNGRILSGKLIEKITISFVGPLFAIRYIAPSGITSFHANLSPGLLLYNESADFLNENVTITGNCFGASGAFGLDVKLVNYLFFGVEANGTSGSLSKIKVRGETIELDEGDYENIGWVGISMGLRLVF